MKKTILYLTCFCMINIARGQQNVGIGTTTPNASAQLDVSSTNKGFLPPRLTFEQRNAIVGPVAGLVIWCIDSEELQVFNGTIWKNMNGKVATYSNFPTIQICSGTWMLKNLDVRNYRNGDPITHITDPTAWANATFGAWCWYNNDSATYGPIYGRLYNWFAVIDPRGLAPAGWHVPTDAEWTTLTNCLGGEAEAGGKMKQTGTSTWQTPNVGATNTSGFTGLPAGSRFDLGGTFLGINNGGRFWSSTPTASNPTTFSYSRSLSYNGTEVSRGVNTDHQTGLSVRCISDY